MGIDVRVAVREDAAAIARVRVETWRAAYDGLIPQHVLDRLDPEREAVRRAELWDQYHADGRMVDLIAEADGELAGWAAVGPSIDDDLPGNGQVYAIYALPGFWGRGVGHALMAAAEEHLRSVGFAEAHLWYLDGNERAGRFYDRHGWFEDGATQVDDRLVGGEATDALHERRRAKRLSAG
jgi:GNAT superfamily N-acetyltransferase